MNKTEYKTSEATRDRANLISNGNGEYALLFLKQNVKELSDYTCQHCHKRFEDNKLHTHHIIPSTLHNHRIDVEDNLVCLCNSCHQQLHGLIKDVDNEDDIIEITNGFLKGTIKSYHEKVLMKSRMTRERQMKIKELKNQLEEINNDLRTNMDLLYSIKATKPTNKEERAEKRYALMQCQDNRLVLKDRKNKIKEALKALAAEKHKILD